MKILHICSGYSKQSLYKNMILSLTSYKINQIVFVPVRSKMELNKNNIQDNKNIKIIYKYILKKLHRLFFFKKLKLVSKVINKEIDFNEIQLIHAHFLFSDGAVALKQKKIFNIPYIVAVRNTDVNFFFKYMFFLRNKGEEILLNAEKIIFVTPKYRDLVLKKYISQQNRFIISEKIDIIPNGLDNFWLKNKNMIDSNFSSSEIKLLYVGDFTPNKNVKAIINSVLQLHNKGIAIHLTLVGGGGYNSEKTLKLVNECDTSLFTFHKRTTSKEQLLNHYRNNNIFIMPSFKETFGIVYLEAMSQGLPILYSENQGIDGYFKYRRPGYSVDPNSLNDICDKILLIFKNFESLSINASYHIDNFSWDKISLEYNNIYSNCINN